MKRGIVLAGTSAFRRFVCLSNFAHLFCRVDGLSFGESLLETWGAFVVSDLLISSLLWGKSSREEQMLKLECKISSGRNDRIGGSRSRATTATRRWHQLRLTECSLTVTDNLFLFGSFAISALSSSLSESDVYLYLWAWPIN